MSSCDNSVNSEGEEEEESVLEAIQVLREARPSQKKSSKRAPSQALDEEPLDQCMGALESKLEGWKASLDKAVMTDLGAWLMHGGTPDTTINTQKGVPAAMLRPSVMNAKHSGCKLAQSIFEQVAPDGDVPTACTLQDVADACTAQRKRGKPAGPPDLLVLIPDAEKVEVHALQLLVRALSSVQATNPGFVPALALGLATHPTLLHPHLDPRILGRLRPAEYRMPSQIHCLGECMVHMQLNFQVPEVLLGPRICTHLAQTVNMFDQRCDLVSLALRFSVISHHTATPTASIVPALQTGDCNKVREALEQLLTDAPDAHKLLKLEAKEASIEPNPAFEPKGGKRKSSGKPSEEVLAAIMALRQTVLDWQLCLHWVHATASASRHAHQLDWWRLATATASPGFIQNPGATDAEARSMKGPNKARKVNAASKPGAAHASSSRAFAGEAYFADTETARQMSSCLSAVSKLTDAEAKALVCQLVDKTDSCTDGRTGELGDHLARLEEFVQAATQAEEKAAEKTTARAAACIHEGSASDEDSDMEDVQLLPGGAVEHAPLRIAGAGYWDACADVAEAQDAHMPHECAEEPGCSQGYREFFTPHAPAVTYGFGEECDGDHACCEVAEGSPMRITGAGGEGGWPGCFEDDNTAKSDDVHQGTSVATRTRRSALRGVIEGQENTRGVSARAHNIVTGSTRGSTTGAVPVVGPAACTRSPFQQHTGTVPSPVGAMHCPQGISGPGGAPKSQKRKSMCGFQKAMGDGCFSVSGTTLPGQSASPAKVSQHHTGLAQTSGTEGGVSTALPPHILSGPGRQMSNSVGASAGARVMVPSTGAAHIADAVLRTRSGAGTRRASSSGAIASACAQEMPLGTTDAERHAGGSTGQGQGNCSGGLDVHTVPPCTQPGGAAATAGAKQPQADRRRSSRSSTGKAVDGGQLASVPEAAAGEGFDPAAAAEAVPGGASGDVQAAAPTRTKPSAKRSQLQDSHTPSQGCVPTGGLAIPGEIATPGQDGGHKRTAAAGGRTPMSVRRTPKQSMGQFLAQQARTPNTTGGDDDADMLGPQQRGRRAGANSLAANVARVLREAWLHVLQTHPSTLPCASVLCYDDAPALKRALHPRMSADMHAVLSNPVPWMQAIQKEHGEHGGATERPEAPHTCIAYQLLRGYSETVDVGDWFASFCLALGSKAADTQNGKRRGKGRTAQKKKKKMRTVERTCDEAGPSSQAAQGDLDGDDGEKLQSAVDLEAAAEDIPRLTAAFCQAVAELELMGYVQRNKRKGTLKLQRTIFPPPMWHT